MRDIYYILDDAGNPVIEESVLNWAEWFEKHGAHRKIAKDVVDGVEVSTIFLGLDHSFGGPKPLIWETMIFGGTHDQNQQRYSTRAEALSGHAEMVAKVKADRHSHVAEPFRGLLNSLAGKP